MVVSSVCEFYGGTICLIQGQREFSTCREDGIDTFFKAPLGMFALISYGRVCFPQHRVVDISLWDSTKQR